MTRPWLRKMVGKRSASAVAKKPRLPAKRLRPAVEELEDRLAPATLTWLGDASQNWGDASNWGGGTVPQSGDTLVFSSANYTNQANFFSSNNNRSGLTNLTINIVDNSSTAGQNFTISGNSIGLAKNNATALAVSGSDTAGIESLNLNITQNPNDAFTIQVDGPALVLGGAVTANGFFKVTKVGAGELKLSGAADNSFLQLDAKAGQVLLAKGNTNVHAVGELFINGAYVQLGGAPGAQIWNGRTIVVNSGTLDLNGQNLAQALVLHGTGVNGAGALVNNSTTASAVDVNINQSAGDVFNVGGSGNLTLNGAVKATGSFAMTKVGTGTLTLSGPADNSFLDLIVDAGTVVLKKDGASARSANRLTVNPNGTVDWRPNSPGGTQVFGNVTLAGGTLKAYEPTAAVSHTSLRTGIDNLNWQRNGSSAWENNRLILTGAPHQAGSAFFTQEVPTDRNFSVSFTYTATNGGSTFGDGFGFVLQRAGSTALGVGGGGLGYLDMPGPKVGVLFNVGQGTAVAVDNAWGAYQPTSAVVLRNTNPKRIQLTYNASDHTLTESIVDQITGAAHTRTYSGIDLKSTLGGKSAYVGFSGGTGNDWVRQQITDFDYFAPGGQDYRNEIQVTVNSTIEVASEEVPFTGVISGPGALTKQGGGRLTLAGINTYSGGTTVAAGTLRPATPAALGSGTITLAGGTLDATPAGTVEAVYDYRNPFQVTAPSTIFVANSNVAFTGAVSGSGQLTKTGAGTLTLAGTTALSGGVDVTAGTLSIPKAATLGDISVAAGATLDLGSGLLGRYYYGTPGFNIQEHLQVLSYVNSQAPALTQLSSATGLNNGFDFGATGSAFPSPFNVPRLFTAVYTGQFHAATEGNYTFTTGSDDGSTLFIDGALVVDNNFNQPFTESPGTKWLTAGLHTIEIVYFNSGGGQGLRAWVQRPGDSNRQLLANSLLAAAAQSVQIGSLSGLGAVKAQYRPLVVGDNTSTTFTGTISGTGSLEKTGSGTLTLKGQAQHTGGTTVSQGTLELLNQTLASRVEIAIGATLEYDVAEESGVTQNAITIAGSGTLLKTGPHTLTFSGATGQPIRWELGPAGQIHVNEGTLVFGQDSNYWLSTPDLQIDALAEVDGMGSDLYFDVLSGAGTLKSNSTINIGAGGTGTFSGVIQGTGRVVKWGLLGTQIFSGANTYTGGTTIKFGTLKLGGTSHNILHDDGDVTIEGAGQLDLNGHIETIGDLVARGSGAAYGVVNTAASTVAGVIASSHQYGSTALTNNAPNASPGGPYTEEYQSTGNSVTLDARSSTDYEDGNQSLVYAWSFGDGSPGYFESPNSSTDGAYDGKTTHLYSGIAVYDGKLTVIDSLFRASQVAFVVRVRDTTAPVTTHAVSGTLGTNGWYKSTVTVTLSATDAAPGDLTTRYSLGDTPPALFDSYTPYTGPIHFNTAGIHTLWYRSKDERNNEEAAKLLVIRIDTQSPEIPAFTVPALTNDSTPTLTATAADATSGVASVQFQYSTDDGTTWSNYGPADTAAPFEVAESLPDGSYWVRAKVTDKAGHFKDSSQQPLVIDTTLPGIVFGATNASFSSTRNQKATIKYTLAEDADVTIEILNGGEVVATLVGPNASKTKTVDHTVEWNGQRSSDGNLVDEGVYTCKITAKDNAGNTTTQSIALTVDNTAPTTPTITQTAFGLSPTFSFAGEETGVTFGYRLATSGDFTAVQGNSLTLPDLLPAAYTIYARAIDAAGNTSAAAILSFGTAVSTTTTLVSGAPTATYGDALTFTATVALAGGSGTPTGSVALKDGTKVLDTKPLDGSGIVSFTVSKVQAGNRTITAHYVGVANLFMESSASVSQTVNARELLVTWSGGTRTYTGLTDTTLTPAVAPLVGDQVIVLHSAHFTDKDVGAGKTINITDISLTGANAANYTVASATATSTTADITARPLVVTVSGGSKTYDGTTAAPVTLTDDRVGNDKLTVAVNAQFSDKHVGTNKTITITGGPLTGDDAGNYGTVSYVWKDNDDQADIAKRALPITVAGDDKDYDGNTDATVRFAFGNSPDDANDGLVLGDEVTVTYAAATFVNANAGKDKPVTVSGVALEGDDAGNYQTPPTTITTTATIRGKAATVDLTGPANAVAGQSLTFTAAVGTPVTGYGNPTGTVTFRRGDIELSVNVEGGSASITFEVPNAGTYTVAAEYSGDDIFAAASDSALLAVTSIATATPLVVDLATSAQDVTVRVTGATVEVVSDSIVVASQLVAETTTVTIAGHGVDRLTIDFSFLTLPVIFTDSVGGVELVIDGGNKAGKYRPSGAGSGTFQVGDGSLTFDGVAKLTATDDLAELTELTLITDGGQDEIVIDSPTPTTNRVSGGNFAPITFGDVTKLVIDTGLNDAGEVHDTVTIDNSGLRAAGLQHFTLVTGAGNDMLLVYAQDLNLPVPNGSFTFAGGDGADTLVGPDPTLSSNVVLSGDVASIPVPVLFVPGLSGSQATTAATPEWFRTIGLQPCQLVLDPFKGIYNDLVMSLENTGHVQGQTLFLAPWDWRLPVAPQDDDMDGRLINLTAVSLTDSVYAYGVDYLGKALTDAASAWAAAYDGRALPAVNLVGHSTGGLIARAYTQSAAYGVGLPKLNDVVMIGVPNQGTTEPWNLLHNDFGADINTRVLGLLLGKSYQDVVEKEMTIATPHGDITLASITVNGAPSPELFIAQYLRSLPDLLPTTPFLNTGTGTLSVGTDTLRNHLLFDLNGGNPNSFLRGGANSFLGDLLVIYSSTESTGYETVQHPAGSGKVVPLGHFLATEATGPRYEVLSGNQNGDSVVTVASATGQFANEPSVDPRVVLKQIEPTTLGGSVLHSALNYDVEAQKEILAWFGQQNDSLVISTGLAEDNFGEVLKRALAYVGDAGFTIGGMKFQFFEANVDHNTATDTYTLTGSVRATINGVGTIEGNLGGGTTTGLVFTGGSLVSLGMVVTSDLTVGGLEFETDDLTLTYEASDERFVLTGTSTFTLGSNSIDVTLGGASTDGLVIQDGKLISLDATLGLDGVLAGTSISGTSLHLAYAAAQGSTPEQFIIGGNATLELGGGRSLALDLGSGGTTGLVIRDGELFSLEATATLAGNFAGGALTGANLAVSYVAADGVDPEKLAVSGEATLNLGNGRTLDLDAALVVSDGVVSRFTGTGTLSNVTLAGADLTNTSLTVTYTAGLEQRFTVSGTADLTLAGGATLALTLGTAAHPDGLVIQDGTISSLAASATLSNVTVAGAALVNGSLSVAYVAAAAASPEMFAVWGGATLTFGAGRALSLALGTESAPGLVIQDGAITSLNAGAAFSNVSVAGATLTGAGLHVTYVAADSEITVSGHANLNFGSGRNLLLTLETTEQKPGLVIRQGMLTSLVASASVSNLSIAGATLTGAGLGVRYVAAAGATPETFAVWGGATLAFGAGRTLVLGLGAESDPGLVIRNGKLTSLDATGTLTNVSIGGARFDATNLRVTYAAAQGNDPETFTVSGQANLNIDGMNSLQVKLGSPATGISEATKGLVIQGGQVHSLDMELDTNIVVSSVTFATDGLRFVYVASSQTYALSGRVGVTVGGIDSFFVTFGNGTNPGLVIQSGTLQHLDLTVDSSISVAGVAFHTKGLRFTYDVAQQGNPEKFTLSGTAGAAVNGLGDINVTFGHGTLPGLVIVGGQLQSLDVTLNTEIEVGALTFSTRGLRFSYTVAQGTPPERFALYGTAGVSVGTAFSLTVTFGDGDKPGLEIIGGEFKRLDVAVSGGFSVGGVAFSAQGLRFIYIVDPTPSFTLSGSASVSVANLGALTVTFGYTEKEEEGGTVHPGLVIVNGQLEKLDMTLDSNITVGALTFSTNGLRFSYTVAQGTTPSRFALYGTAGVSVGPADNPTFKLDVTFGDGSNPGLLIENGAFKKLDVSVDTNFSVGSVQFFTDELRFKYDVDLQRFALSGTAGAAVAGINGGNSFAVTFGYQGSEGLVIEAGALVSLDMTVNASITVSSLSFSLENMRFQYTTVNQRFVMTGKASVAVAKVQGVSGGAISVTFGGGTTDGLVVTQGTLESLDMTVDSDFKVGGMTFVVDKMNFTYSAAGSRFTLTGAASVTMALFTFTVQLGSSGAQASTGLVISNGQLQSLDATVKTTFGVQGFNVGSVSLRMVYQANPEMYVFSGNADLTLTVSLPAPVATFLGIASNGSWHIGNVGFTVQYVVGNNSTSYAQAYVTVAGQNVGLKVWFDGRLEPNIGGLGAEAFINAWNEAKRIAEEVARAIEDAAKRVAEWVVQAANSVASWFQSWAFWGYLEGATVYYDANSNYVLDPGEWSTVTGTDGSFTRFVPEDPTVGQFVVFGGTDISTGLPNTAVASAPADARVISPLTTLVNQVRQLSGGTDGSELSRGEANTLVALALGLSPEIDLTEADPIRMALGGDAAAAEVFAAEVKVATLIYEMDGLLSGAPAAPERTTFSAATYSILAGILIEHQGTAVDFGNSQTMNNLVQRTAAASQVTLNGTNIHGAAVIMADVITQIESLPVSGTESYLRQVVQAQVVAASIIAPLLGQVAAGDADIAEVVADNTGAALAAKIDDAPIGSLLPAVTTPPSPVEGSVLPLHGAVLNPVVGDIVAYHWTVFKDGATVEYASSTGTDWSFTPGDDGVYRIILTISNGTDSAQVEQTITVANVAPTPTITLVSEPREQWTRIDVTAAATDPAGLADALTYTWQVYKDASGAAFANGFSADWSFIPDEGGTYRIVLTVSDGDGGTATAERLISVAAAELTRPSVAAAVTVAPNGNGWYNRDVTVHFTIVGDVAAAPADQVMSAEGAAVSSTPVVVTDSAGNVSAPSNIVTVRIDKTGPQTSVVLAGTSGLDGWYSSAVQVSFSATDNLSGVAGIEYRLNGGDWTSFGRPFTLIEGAYTVDYRATDQAGNVEAYQSASLRFDTIAPTTTASVSGPTKNSSGWYTGPVTISLQAADQPDLSGPAATYYSVDGGAPQTSTGSLVLTANGRHVVTFWSVDKAGNIEAAKSLSVQVDATAPTTGLAAGGAHAPGSFFTWGSADGGSGVAGTVVEVDGVVVSTADAGSLARLAGIHTVRVITTDVAGNVTTETQVYQTTGMAIVDGNLVVIGTDRPDLITITGSADGAAGQVTVMVISPTATGVDITIGVFSRTAQSGQFTITRNGVTLSVSSVPIQQIKRFIVHALAGDDLVGVISSSNAEIHGGDGNDTLVGGAGDDVIWGDAGADMITGSAGNDVLIGGSGSDRLVGSVGHDMLISGELIGTHNGAAYDYATLRAIDDAWANLWAVDADLGSPVDDVLDEAFTADILTGSSGHDWFILGSLDKITDKNSVNKDGDKIVVW